MSAPSSTEPGPAARDADLDDVPKLPRGRGLRFSKPELVRIALTLTMLVGVIALTRPCSDAVSNFVMGFDGSNGETSKTMPRPGTIDTPVPGQQFEQLRPDMTEAELKAAIERSKARAGGSAAGSGTGAPEAGAPGTGTGAAP